MVTKQRAKETWKYSLQEMQLKFVNVHSDTKLLKKLCCYWNSIVRKGDSAQLENIHSLKILSHYYSLRGKLSPI